MNSVNIIGNLTRDPELRHTPGGTAVAKLGVAVNSKIKDASGEWTEKANFVDVTCFGKLAEVVCAHLEKGRQVGVSGRLDYSSWEAQDGSKRSKLEVVANEVKFLGGGQGGGSGQSSAPAQTEMPAGQDDDIPF